MNGDAPDWQSTARTFLSFRSAGGAGALRDARGVSGRVSTLWASFARSKRRIRIYVPPKVESNPPVLVLFDGQNALDDHGSFAGGWRAHEAIAKLPSTIRRPVLVAIDHGHDRRIHELWRGLDETLDLVRHVALPEAEREVGLRFDPHARVIGGASMGGLASLAAVARHPDWFASALAMSPSTWIAPAAIRHELAHARVDHARFYVDVGLRESTRMVRESQLTARLLARRLGESRVMWRPDQRGLHREKDWRRRLPKALRFLFRRSAP